MKKMIFILVCIQLFTACNKKELPGNCENLEYGILNNNEDKVGAAINNMIGQLGNRTYNEQNLSALVHGISSHCNIVSEYSCFDCIKTLPSQSEIILTLTTGGTTIKKVIDISYTTSNIMTFRNMHD